MENINNQTLEGHLKNYPISIKESKIDLPLIILVHYINVGDKSVAKAKEIVYEYYNMMENHFSNVNIYNIKNIIMPTRDQDNKVECIFPKDLNDETKTKLTEIETKQLEFFKNGKE